MTLTIKTLYQRIVALLLAVFTVAIVFLPLVTTAEVGGSITRDISTTDSGTVDTLILNISPTLTNCTGVAPKQCMTVNGKLFYDNIKGFSFTEGYTYQLEVTRSARENVPADASSYEYTLVKVLSKTAAPTTNTTGIAAEAIRSIQQQFDALVGSYLQFGSWTHEHGTFTFTKDRFSTSAGCNTITGTYTRNGFTMTFSNIISTKKMCLDNAVMTAEASLITTLADVHTFTITKQGISIGGSADTLSLVR